MDQRKLIEDLVEFFEKRGHKKVASGLKADLQQIDSGSEADLLGAVRRAVTSSAPLHKAKTSTHERDIARRDAPNLLPQKESDEIVERLVTKLVQNPSSVAKEREKVLNKRIESVFELESFQRMVETSDGRLSSHAFRDLHASKNFIRGSEIIQQ